MPFSRENIIKNKYIDNKGTLTNLSHLFLPAKYNTGGQGAVNFLGPVKSSLVIAM